MEYHIFVPSFIDFLGDLLGIFAMSLAILSFVFAIMHGFALLIVTQVHPNRWTIYYLVSPFIYILFFITLYYIPIAK